MSSPSAVLFDWGGTLTSFHNVDLIDAWRVAAEVLAPDRADEVAQALLAAESEVWQRTETSMRSGRIDEVLAAASRAVGLPVDDAVHQLATSAYFDHWTPTTGARADAQPTLTALKERGLVTGLLSNTHWPRDQHEQWLRRDGLIDLLDVRVYTSDLEHVKPHPEAFGALLAQLDVDPSTAVFVGDRLWDDIEGARRLGMRTIWVRNAVVPSYDVEPDAAVDALGDVVDVVDGWLVPAAAG
jgi:putative hydrolase of the HAD superfamily